MRYRFILGFVAIILGIGLAGCPSITPERQAELTTQATAASTQAAALIQQLDTQIAAVVASTQTTPPPTTQTIVEEQKQEKALRQAKATVVAAKNSVDAVGPILIAVAGGQDPGAAITAAAPMTGPAAPYVALAGILVTLGFGVYQNIKKNQAVAAGQTAVDAVQGAIASGQMTIANPASASASVDAALTVDHAISNRLVDVIAAATPTPVVVPTPAPKVEVKP